MPKQANKRKTHRGVRHGDKVEDALERDLKATGSSETYYLARVVSSRGGGRFIVKDLKNYEHIVGLSGVLKLKGKAFQKAHIPIAIAPDSWVIVEGDHIGAVIGAHAAGELKKLYKASAKVATPVGEENFFNRSNEKRENGNNNGNSNSGSRSRGRKGRATRKANNNA
jgi:hypothetical protein